MTNLDRNKNDTHINLKLKKINKFAATLITVPLINHAWFGKEI